MYFVICPQGASYQNQTKAALNPIAPDVSTQFESCTIDKDALITA